MATPKYIDRIWMVVSFDENDQTEGVCAEWYGGTWVPLIAADEDRLSHILKCAKELAMRDKRLIKIVRLHNRTEEQVFDGRR